MDGDTSQIASRGEGDVLDGWTLGCALLARTTRLRIGSIRLVHHWNAAKLAQAIATQERITPGRLRFLMSIGGQRSDAHFGLPLLPPGDRIAWLDETLHAARRLWRGETVTTHGRFVRLDGARVRPVLATPPAVEIAARSARLLERVARHADVWDVNLPPIPDRVAAAARCLDDACRRQGRDPASISRSMWIFARPGLAPDDPALPGEIRRWCPWFRELADTELVAATASGRSAAESVARFRALAHGCRIDAPVADLSGLDADAARRAIDALAPEVHPPRDDEPLAAA